MRPGRVGQDDLVAWIDERGDGRADGLVGAAGDHDLALGIDGHPVFPLELTGNRLARSPAPPDWRCT